MRLDEYLEKIVSLGRYFFTLPEVKNALNVSQIAIRSALHRLKKKGKIANPLKGFYIIIPPEYKSIGSLPPEQFIPDLMKHLKTPYYVGLLSAAFFYGSTHQQPQQFQVLVPKNRRKINCGKVQILFIAKKNIAHVPTKKFNTTTSIISVSTPEATAIDLIIYPKHSGGMMNVFDILSDLIDQMRIEPFKKLLEIFIETPILQRFGYLMSLLWKKQLADLVYEKLKDQWIRPAVLDTNSSNKKGKLDSRWKLLINIKLEKELDS